MKMPLLSDIDAFLCWSKVRAVGSSTATKLTIFIPLIGYLILFNEEVVGFLKLSKDLLGMDSDGEGQVSTRLLMIYFGLCFIATGSVLFQICCPKEVSQHQSQMGYVSEARQNLSPLQVDDIKKILNEEKAYLEELNKIEAQYQEKKQVDKKKAAEMFDRDLLIINHRFQDARRPLARYSTALFFGFGILLLLIPSAKVFVTVLFLLL